MEFYSFTACDNNLLVAQIPQIFVMTNNVHKMQFLLLIKWRCVVSSKGVCLVVHIVQVNNCIYLVKIPLFCQSV